MNVEPAVPSTSYRLKEAAVRSLFLFFVIWAGFELVSAMRERDPDLADRVIFVTGDTLSPATRAQIEQSGNLFLPKPFSIEQLEAILQQLVRRRSQSSDNR